MKLLILGGTNFIGRHILETAVKKGHKLTIFNRGKTSTDKQNEIEYLIGDRLNHLAALENRQWDAVIDTSGFVHHTVEKTAKLLRENVGQYIYLSSISVYRDISRKGATEDAPRLTITRTEADKLTKDTAGPVYSHYGQLKSLAEDTVLEHFPENSLIIRAGIIVGAYDYSDRFTYWVTRISEGGKILAPGNTTKKIQLISAHDLANWLIYMVEKKQTGIFNAVGPETELTMESLLEGIKKALNANAEFCWRSDQYLLDNRVAPFVDLPLWLPETEKQTAGFFEIDATRAIKHGLTFSSIEEIAREVYDWYRENPRDLKVGMTRKRETELLLT